MTSCPVWRRNSRKVLLLVGAAPAAFELAFFLGGDVLAAFFIVLVGLLLTFASFASFITFASFIGGCVVGGATMFGAVLGLAFCSPPVELALVPELELALIPELELALELVSELALELVPELIFVLAALLWAAFF